MAPSPYTTTYTVLGKTYRYTHNYDYPTDTSTYRYGGYNPFNDTDVRAVIAGYAIALGELLIRLVFGCLDSPAHMLVMYSSCGFRSSIDRSYRRCHRLLQATEAKKGKHVASSLFGAGVK
jgi:hypothetical protein